MLKAPELVALRAANPVSRDEARRLADAIDLRARLLAVPAEPSASASVARPTRRRFVIPVIAACMLLAAILSVTPAWGPIRNVLPFWTQPKAPQPVRIHFSSLNLGAPAGMSPRAVSGETRKVGRFTFGGTTHTLWVAPAKNGGFCSLWLPLGGGGCSTLGKPLSTGALLRFGVPQWITGDALARVISDVVIRFSDGTVVSPRIVWVSAPIDAGFFAYDVPPGRRTSRIHVTGIDAYDWHGRLVEHQVFH